MDQLQNSIIMKTQPTQNLIEQEKYEIDATSTRASIVSIDKNSKLLDFFELENQLKIGLSTCKIRDVSELSDRMKRTEIRIQDYEAEDRNEEAQKERRYLHQLKQMQDLQEKISLKSIEFLSSHIDKLELSELEHRMNYGLAKCKIKDVSLIPDRIKRIEMRIEQYEEEDRTDEAQQEMRYLRSLKLLQLVIQEIFRRKSTDLTTNSDETMSQNKIIKVESDKRVDLSNLLEDLTDMPCCAQKTTIELLHHFQKRLLGDCALDTVMDSVHLKLGTLQTQIQEEELFSEQIKAYCQDLNRSVHNNDCYSTVDALSRILKKIRPLNIREIQRLMQKSRTTAELVENKDIILLLGVTGSGKSTTIQFLSGAQMKNIPVEIAPGKFLEHICIDGPVINPALASIISSPLSTSETRYLASVTIPLNQIFGQHKTGEIILCDAPGFGDTAGAEVEIANSLGVIEAIKKCRSVKILALSSYRSLGDRGEGIETLAKILVNLIDGIEKRLYAVYYGFTKYPSQMDIHSLLVDIKNSKVDQDPILRSNHSFVAVLTDMIEKTKDDDGKIDPIVGDRKVLIKKLENLKGIRYPNEVLQFTISKETIAKVLNQVHQYKLSIICSLKHNNITLIKYYLNHFKLLSDLTNENFVRDGYSDSLRFLSDKFKQYYTDVIERLRLMIVSQYVLKEKDVQDCKTSHDYIEQIQILREHLGSELVSTDILIDNILCELAKRHVELQEYDFSNPLNGTYLNNFYLLQSSFKELQLFYSRTCAEMCQRFELVFGQSVLELISANEFKRVAEILVQISKCIPSLNHHFNGKVDEKYRHIIKSILKYLENVSKKGNNILEKFHLNESDIKILQDNMSLLRSAKETSLLQDQILKIENRKHLNSIYDEFIGNVIKYFDEIILRIKDILEKSGYNALESVERLMSQIEMIRFLPEIESKTAQTFYRTIENIHGYMRQVQRDAEQLLGNLDFQAEVINVRPLARLLLRLEKTAWIDRFHPGASDAMMYHIREELVEHVDQLEHRLRKLDFTTKHPQHIPRALQMIEKLDSIIDLERNVPKLKEYRDRINECFLQSTKVVLNDIKKSFNLSDKTLDDLKWELFELEQIKDEYNLLYPACGYLREVGYNNIDLLNNEIENVKQRQYIELEQADREGYRIGSQLKDLQLIVGHCKSFTTFNLFPIIVTRNFPNLSTVFHRSVDNTNDYLRAKGYPCIEIVNETIVQIQEDYNKVFSSIESKRRDFNSTLVRLEQIREKYTSLLASENLKDQEEIEFFQEKGYPSYELLASKIEEKRNRLNEYKTHGQIYYFRESLDVLAANNALIYTSNCEKARNNNVKEAATDADELLRTYIKEFGNFLNKEIERNFCYITKIERKDPGQYSNELDRLFNELCSLQKHTLVFECLNGAKKIAYWHREFNNYHHFLHDKMEEYKFSGGNEDFQLMLKITKALSCLDHNCRGALPGNGFHDLYRQHHIDMSRMSQETYKLIIDYITQGDYANADLGLSDIVENKKFLSQIKQNLIHSLNTLMKNGKAHAYWLDGKIAREDNYWDKLKEINESLEKVRTVLSRHHIVGLVDEQTQHNLHHFENEISQIVSKAILNVVQSIESLINANSIFEAEKIMENLNRAVRELSNCHKSKCVSNKIEELRTRLDTLPNYILQRYDFADISNYAKDPPRDLLDQLNRASSGGYTKYSQVSGSLMEKIRVSFSLGIKSVRDDVLYDRPAKISGIKTAFCFLPDTLKRTFKTDVDELSELNQNKRGVPEFD